MEKILHLFEKFNPKLDFNSDDEQLKNKILIILTLSSACSSLVYHFVAMYFGITFLMYSSLTMALLTLPVIIVSVEEALKTVPRELREASLALGATKWQTVADHLLPYSAPSILTGIIIGLARAIGESAPIITIGALTFIAFLPNSPVINEFPFISFEWLFAPFTVMPIQMFNWVSRPEEAFQFNAAAAGLVLVVMTLTMNALAIYLRYQMRKNIKW